MHHPDHPTPEQLAQATLPFRRSLRTLYRSARLLQPTDPYAAARLGRIADQAEYFLLQWPEQQWPTAATRPDWPMPEKSALLACLNAVRQEVSAGGVVAPSRWQQAQNTLLSALVVFA